jgi:hypothetical protein
VRAKSARIKLSKTGFAPQIPVKGTTKKGILASSHIRDSGDPTTSIEVSFMDDAGIFMNATAAVV